MLMYSNIHPSLAILLIQFDYQLVLIDGITINQCEWQVVTYFEVSIREKHEWNITVVIVAQSQNTAS